MRMRDVLDPVLEWLPAGRRRCRYGDVRGVANVGAIQGGFGWRVSRTPHRDRPLPRPARAAGRADGGGAAGGRSSSRARARTGVEAEVYVTAPGAEIDEGHPLVGALEGAHEEVFGAPPERDVTRWFSDASVLTRYGIATVNYGTSSGLPDPELRREPRDRRARQDAEVYARAAQRICAMKLVTFDDGQVGRIDGEEIAVLDVPDDARVVRARRRGRDRRARRARRGDAARADRPEEVLPHGRQLPRARGGVEARRLVARDRALDRLLPERRRDRRAGRAGRLSRAPDRGARLRARAGGRDAQGRQVVPAGGGDGLRRRLRDLQRHHRARHPAARDALRRLQLLQGDRHVLPARAVDRDAGRDPRPARPRDGAARQRRVAADLALGPHVA